MRQITILAATAAFAFSGQQVLAHPGNGHGHGNDNRYGGPVGYGTDRCPPGLAKKHNGCLPPGQARKLYRGDRWQSGYGTYYSYGRIPYDVRRRYALSTRY